MAKLIKFTRKYEDGIVETHYKFWCPPCKCTHSYNTSQSPRPRWSFNGNMEKPTFNPSLLIFHPVYKKDAQGQILRDAKGKPVHEKRKTICHLFVRDGMIDYCSDCPHEFRGRKIPLEEIPKGWC